MNIDDRLTKVCDDICTSGDRVITIERLSVGLGASNSDTGIPDNVCMVWHGVT